MTLRPEVWNWRQQYSTSLTHSRSSSYSFGNGTGVHLLTTQVTLYTFDIDRRCKFGSALKSASRVEPSFLSGVSTQKGRLPQTDRASAFVSEKKSWLGQGVWSVIFLKFSLNTYTKFGSCSLHVGVFWEVLGLFLFGYGLHVTLWKNDSSYRCYRAEFGRS